jgi:hypothetical protein
MLPHNIIIITIIFEEIITTSIKQISIKGNLCVLLYIWLVVHKYFAHKNEELIHKTNNYWGSILIKKNSLWQMS